jgi:hypothetical protein
MNQKWTYYNIFLFKSVSFKVNFKGNIIPVESWSLDSTIRELKEYLVENTGVPSEFQKLLYKSKDFFFKKKLIISSI